MNSKDKRVQIYVHPSFKKVLFKEAIDKNTPVIEFTKKVAMEANPIDKLVEDMNVKYKKKKFDFM